jgi:hypothetical protein
MRDAIGRRAFAKHDGGIEKFPVRPQPIADLYQFAIDVAATTMPSSLLSLRAAVYVPFMCDRGTATSEQHLNFTPVPFLLLRKTSPHRLLKGDDRISVLVINLGFCIMSSAMPALPSGPEVCLRYFGPWRGARERRGVTSA